MTTPAPTTIVAATTVRAFDGSLHQVEELAALSPLGGDPDVVAYLDDGGFVVTCGDTFWRTLPRGLGRVDDGGRLVLYGTRRWGGDTSPSDPAHLRRGIEAAAARLSTWKECVLERLDGRPVLAVRVDDGGAHGVVTGELTALAERSDDFGHVAVPLAAAPAYREAVETAGVRTSGEAVTAVRASRLPEVGGFDVVRAAALTVAHVRLAEAVDGGRGEYEGLTRERGDAIVRAALELAAARL